MKPGSQTCVYVCVFVCVLVGQRRDKPLLGSGYIKLNKKRNKYIYNI